MRTVTLSDFEAELVSLTLRLAGARSRLCGYGDAADNLSALADRFEAPQQRGPRLATVDGRPVLRAPIQQSGSAPTGGAA